MKFREHYFTEEWIRTGVDTDPYTAHDVPYELFKNPTSSEINDSYNDDGDLRFGVLDGDLYVWTSDVLHAKMIYDIQYKTDKYKKYKKMNDDGHKLANEINDIAGKLRDMDSGEEADILKAKKDELLTKMTNTKTPKLKFSAQGSYNKRDRTRLFLTNYPDSKDSLNPILKYFPHIKKVNVMGSKEPYLEIED